jgi:hypothetical protein
LLKKLSPFLATLSVSELAEMSIAAKAKQRPSLFRQPKPPQPIEVVMVREDKHVVGVLLLRGRWMEEVFERHRTNPTTDTTTSTKSMANLFDPWLGFLPSEVGSWLSRQIEYLPLSLYHEVLIHENPETILDLLEEQSPGTIPEALQVWFVMEVLEHLMQRGTTQQKRRIKTIFEHWRPSGHGAPSKEVEERKDVDIALRVEEAKQRLANGVRFIREQRTRGGYQHDSPETIFALRALGYTLEETGAIFESRVTKTSSGAAFILVARQQGTTPKVISAAASRGRRYISRIRA